MGEIPKDSVLLPVPVAVLKHGDRHNVREKGSLLIHSAQSTVGTERRRQGLKQLLTPHPHPGSREWRTPAAPQPFFSVHTIKDPW